MGYIVAQQKKACSGKQTTRTRLHVCLPWMVRLLSWAESLDAPAVRVAPMVALPPAVTVLPRAVWVMMSSWLGGFLLKAVYLAPRPGFAFFGGFDALLALDVLRFGFELGQFGFDGRGQGFDLYGPQ